MPSFVVKGKIKPDEQGKKEIRLCRSLDLSAKSTQRVCIGILVTAKNAGSATRSSIHHTNEMVEGIAHESNTYLRSPAWIALAP